MIQTQKARESMVDCQVRPSDVTRYAIIEAMLWCPRERFVPAAWRDVAYGEVEIPLPAGRAIPTARTLAKMLEAAAIGPGDLVLDLAPGLGYSTALIARMAEAVVAVEPNPEMAAAAQAALDGLEIVNAVVSVGDPTAGDPQHGPFDVVFLAAGVERLPAALIAQLKEGGRLVALEREGPIGRCRVWTRSGEIAHPRTAFDAVLPVLAGFERPTEFAF